MSSDLATSIHVDTNVESRVIVPKYKPKHNEK